MTNHDSTTIGRAGDNLPGADLDETVVEHVARAVHRTWCDSEEQAAEEWADIERRWNYLLDARTSLRALKEINDAS